MFEYIQSNPAFLAGDAVSLRVLNQHGAPPSDAAASSPRKIRATARIDSSKLRFESFAWFLDSASWRRLRQLRGLGHPRKARVALQGRRRGGPFRSLGLRAPVKSDNAFIGPPRGSSRRPTVSSRGRQGRACRATYRYARRTRYARSAVRLITCRNRAIDVIPSQAIRYLLLPGSQMSLDDAGGSPSPGITADAPLPVRVRVCMCVRTYMYAVRLLDRDVSIRARNTRARSVRRPRSTNAETMRRPSSPASLDCFPCLDLFLDPATLMHRSHRIRTSD